MKSCSLALRFQGFVPVATYCLRRSLSSAKTELANDNLPRKNAHTRAETMIFKIPFLSSEICSVPKLLCWRYEGNHLLKENV